MTNHKSAVRVSFANVIASIGLVLYSIQYFIALNRKVPFYIKDVDPSYEYLINGLNITNLSVPGHTDHPGTPLQLIIALSIILLFQLRSVFGLIDSNKSMNMDVVLNSENYIYISLSFILCIHIISLIYLMRGIKKNLDINQFYLLPYILLFSGNFFSEISSLKPENLFIPISNILCALLIKVSKGVKYNNFNKSIVIISATSAIALTTKLTLIPFFIFFLFILPIKYKFIFSIYTFVFSLAILVPIRNVFSVSWFYNILINNGRWGEERAGKNLSQIFSDISLVWVQNYPLVAVCLTLIIIFSATSNRKHFVEDNSIIRQLFLLTMFISALIYKEVQFRDLISLAPVSSLLLIILISRIKPILAANVKRFKFNRFIIGFLGSYLIILIFRGSLLNVDFSKGIPNWTLNNDLKTLSGQNSIGFYTTPTHASGLMFGEAYYGSPNYLNEISRLYPNYFEFSIWSGDFLSTRGKSYSCHEIREILVNKNNYVYASPSSDINKVFEMWGINLELGSNVYLGNDVKQAKIREIKCND